MSKRKAIILAAALLVAALSVAGLALAQVSSSYDLSWNAISGGGGTMSSLNFRLQGGISPPAAGLSSSTGYRLEGGFWPGIWEWFRLYLPAIFKAL